jgi:putative protein-disulfide isomerase
MKKNTTLIYVGDPMCSWCYGFSPELVKVVEALKEKVKFELVLGGLRPYNTQTMVELKAFLTKHWQDVSDRSGQSFCFDILDNTSITYDTEPPSRATVVIRTLAPEKEFSFYKQSHSLFYKENKNMHLPESYRGLVESLDINFDNFKSKFESQEMKDKTKQDFLKARSLGVQSFPTLLLQSQHGTHKVAAGYAKAENILSKIEEQLY